MKECLQEGTKLVQAIADALFNLPSTESPDGPLVQLPQPTTRLPREKPVRPHFYFLHKNCVFLISSKRSGRACICNNKLIFLRIHGIWNNWSVFYRGSFRIAFKSLFCKEECYFNLNLIKLMKETFPRKQKNNLQLFCSSSLCLVEGVHIIQCKDLIFQWGLCLLTPLPEQVLCFW